MNYNFKAPKSELIECAIGANVTGNMQQTKFNQQPQLQSNEGDKKVYIKAIEAYTRDMMAFSPLTPANPVATAADLANAALLISVAGVIEFNMIPLVSLCRVQGTVSPSVWSLFQFRNLWEVNWVKTTILTVLAPITTPPFSYLFNVYYDYVPDEEDIVTGYKSIHQF